MYTSLHLQYEPSPEIQVQFPTNINTAELRLTCKISQNRHFWEVEGLGAEFLSWCLCRFLWFSSSVVWSSSATPHQSADRRPIRTWCARCVDELWVNSARSVSASTSSWYVLPSWWWCRTSWRNVSASGHLVGSHLCLPLSLRKKVFTSM